MCLQPPLLHRSLFIQIVERLLIEKPDNPIGFIVEYLAKRYPDETRAAKFGHAASQRTGSLASNITTTSRRDKTCHLTGSLGLVQDTTTRYCCLVTRNRHASVHSPCSNSRVLQCGCCHYTPEYLLHEFRLPQNQTFIIIKPKTLQ